MGGKYWRVGGRWRLEKSEIVLMRLQYYDLQIFKAIEARPIYTLKGNFGVYIMVC